MDSSESLLGEEKNNHGEYKGELYGEQPEYIGIGSWASYISEEEEEEQEEEDVLEGPLEEIESVGIITLLQDAIDELTILKYVIGAPEVFWSLNYRNLSERYSRRLTPERVFPEVDSRPVLTSAIKLQRDRESIEVVFQKLIMSLTEGRDYSPLVHALNCLMLEEEDDIMLINELRKNLVDMKNLTLKVEEKRKLDELEERERDELMYQLQDELDDVILKCNVEEKFVDKWENVRNAQNDWRLQMSENDLKDNIAKLSTKAKLEKRVTQEMQNYLRLCQLELEEELEDWMERYDEEMERRENKIIHLKYDREQAIDKKHNLQKQFETKLLEMREWIQFREQRKIKIAASLIIQSWLRGLIVRKKLGPYKQKKHKGKQKDEKKKN